MRNYWWALLIAAVAIGAGLKYGLATPTGKNIADHLKIKLPVFGTLFKKIYLVRFTQSLATLVVGIAMMIFVIPQLTSMLTASGAALPISTRILIGSSEVMRNYWWALLIAAVAIGAGLKY
ncbi:MAG: Type II secretion system protein, partial [Parcubacteria group bacterium GW2011_GWF2_45_11]